MAQYQRKIQELEQIIGKQAIVIQSKKTVIHPGGKQ
ncbi:transposase ISCc3 [Thermosipho africanus H17ap60334]|nr:transposase ISCc3 [Thermosipho africanus H17ap60334]